MMDDLSMLQSCWRDASVSDAKALLAVLEECQLANIENPDRLITELWTASVP